MNTFTAHDGLELPVLGFGTYKLKGYEGADAVAGAISKGYTLLDSAFNYENEGSVAEGVRRSGAARSEIIYTSKLPGRHQAYDDATITIEESLLRTGFEYMDLYLIHWPNPRVGKFVEAWQAMIEAKEETGVLPEVNQIELHPYFPQVEQVAYDHAHGIITEAWSPLRRGELLSDPVITEIAAKHGATTGQVVLAWHIARDILAIPKAFSPARQLENLGALELQLDPAEVEAITALGRPDGRMRDQDPAVYEEF